MSELTSNSLVSFRTLCLQGSSPMCAPRTSPETTAKNVDSRTHHCFHTLLSNRLCSYWGSGGDMSLLLSLLVESNVISYVLSNAAVTMGGSGVSCTRPPRTHSGKTTISPKYIGTYSIFWRSHGALLTPTLAKLGKSKWRYFTNWTTSFFGCWIPGLRVAWLLMWVSSDAHCSLHMLCCMRWP